MKGVKCGSLIDVILRRFEVTPMPNTLATPPATLALRKIASVRVIGPHRLSVRFRDGLVGELDFTSWLKKRKGPAIGALRRADLSDFA